MTDHNTRAIELDKAELDRVRGGGVYVGGGFVTNNRDESGSGGNTVYIAGANGGVWKTTNG